MIASVHEYMYRAFLIVVKFCELIVKVINPTTKNSNSLSVSTQEYLGFHNSHLFSNSGVSKIDEFFGMFFKFPLPNASICKTWIHVLLA